MIVLAGMTATGKNTIRDELVNMGFTPIVTYTTRPMRKNETDGVTYHFISKPKFFLLKLVGFFQETTSYRVASSDTWYYGTSRKSLFKADTDSVIIANPNGLKKIKSLEKFGLLPNVFTVLLQASPNTIKNRLSYRGDNEGEAARRYKADLLDFINVDRNADYKISNDNIFQPNGVAKKIAKAYQEYRMNRGEL